MQEPCDWLLEQIKTCKNLCMIAEILIEQERKELLPTILELLFVEIDNIVEEHCTVGQPLV